MWPDHKAWWDAVRVDVILAMLAMLGTALEPALKVVSWRVFGDCFPEHQVSKALGVVGIPIHASVWIADAVIYTGPTLAICLALCAWLVRPFTGGPSVTRCRKCRSILQELDEARCPECGEAI